MMRIYPWGVSLSIGTNHKEAGMRQENIIIVGAAGMSTASTLRDEG